MLTSDNFILKLETVNRKRTAKLPRIAVAYVLTYRPLSRSDAMHLLQKIGYTVSYQGAYVILEDLRKVGIARKEKGFWIINTDDEELLKAIRTYIEAEYPELVKKIRSSSLGVVLELAYRDRRGQQTSSQETSVLAA